MNNITIKNNVSLARDLTSGAVINTNDSLYQQKIKDDQFDSEFNALKTDVNEIKTLLKTLLASKE
jgi:hypothetical protein